MHVCRFSFYIERSKRNYRVFKVHQMFCQIWCGYSFCCMKFPLAAVAVSRTQICPTSIPKHLTFNSKLHFEGFQKIHTKYYLYNYQSAIVRTFYYFTFLKKKKEIWLSLMTKPLIQTENSNTNWQHKNAIEHFDYTTIADRLRTTVIQLV